MLRERTRIHRQPPHAFVFLQPHREDEVLHPTCWTQTTSDTSRLTVLRCPEMTQSNDWMICSAPLLVTEELASLTDVSWETITEMENVTNRALIDFDDISIKWKSGVG